MKVAIVCGSPGYIPHRRGGRRGLSEEEEPVQEKGKGQQHERELRGRQHYGEGRKGHRSERSMNVIILISINSCINFYFANFVVNLV